MVEDVNYEKLTVGQNDMGKEDANYERLIAAQNESTRRLKIKSINNTLSEENRKKTMCAIASGVCFAGLMVATHFSGIDMSQAIQTEIEALNSFDALKEYLGTFTPAMWGTMIATVTSYSKAIKHNKKYNEAKQELCDMLDNQPKDYLNIVEHQAKGR